MDRLQQTAATVSDSLGTMVAPIANFWEETVSKGGGGTEKKSGLPTFGLFGDQSTKSNKNKSKSKPVWKQFGPGGAVGVGCGAGIGVAITGAAGVGSEPWNAVRLVVGVGIGCGMGLGYGFGLGHGVRWDKRPKKPSESSKRIVIEI